MPKDALLYDRLQALGLAAKTFQPTPTDFETLCLVSPWLDSADPSAMFLSLPAIRRHSNFRKLTCTAARRLVLQIVPHLPAKPPNPSTQQRATPPDSIKRSTTPIT
jgi:hypothetical protein